MKQAVTFRRVKRLEFVVGIDQPKGASVADVKAYVEDAVGSWWGQFRPPGGNDEADPGDPLWDVGKTVTVKRLHKPRTPCPEAIGLNDS